MVGSATFTIVESNTIITWAAEITANAKPRCLPCVLLAAGSTGAVVLDTMSSLGSGRDSGDG